MTTLSAACPRCNADVYPGSSSDEVWCLVHGTQYIGVAMDKPDTPPRKSHREAYRSGPTTEAVRKALEGEETTTVGELAEKTGLSMRAVQDSLETLRHFAMAEVVGKRTVQIVGQYGGRRWINEWRAL